MEKSLDLTDEEYLILDTVAKDINMIQLLYTIPVRKLEVFKKYLTEHCNSYVFDRFLNKPRIGMNLQLPINEYAKLYNRKYNIMVYLIGEIHTNQNDCKNTLEDFIHRLGYYPYLIDVFTELPRYILNTQHKSFSENLQILNLFHRSIKYSKNVRTHEVDIRTLQPSSLEKWKVIEQLQKNTEYKVSERFLNEELQPFPKVMIDRIYKQISKVYDPKYKKIMKKFADKSIKEFNDLRAHILKTNEYTNRSLLRALTITDNLLMLSIMDPYVIARMHRDFKQNGVYKNNCSARPHNIIYIGGYFHTSITKYYLQKMDYEVLIDNFSKDEKCMKTEDTLPLFFRPI